MNAKPLLSDLFRTAISDQGLPVSLYFRGMHRLYNYNISSGAVPVNWISRCCYESKSEAAKAGRKIKFSYIIPASYDIILIIQKCLKKNEAYHTIVGGGEDVMERKAK